MDKARQFLKRKPSYEPIHDDSSTQTDGEDGTLDDASPTKQPTYSQIEYIIYMLLGVAMLWAWNMFLAAAPYLQRRFHTSQTLLSNFQAAEVSISTIGNLGAMLVLTKLQHNARYPRRIITSLLINIICFLLLALSTKTFTAISATGYFIFTMIMVFASSTATGFMQNGAFAYAAGMKRPEYLQGIMTGQAIAGVLPPLVQIASVLSVGDTDTANPGEQVSSTSALVYFLTATAVCVLTFFAFTYLLRRHRTRGLTTHTSDLQNTPSSPTPTTVPLTRLFSRLLPLATAVFLTFGITMVFPVFTQEILSVNPTASPLLRPAAFIPLAFLTWNIGDLLGRLIPLIPALSLAGRPRVLLLLSILRAVWVPLYLTCNIQAGHAAEPDSVAYAAPLQAAMAAGAVTIRSDAFYLLVVQLPFGLTNGYLGSCCMMGTGACVDEDEREAAGSFMGLCLVAGLAVGSLCSFFVGNA